MKFQDPFQPTNQELIEWANESESLEPVEDFAIFVTDACDWKLIFKFASDKNCPKKDTFLNYLYFIVGDTVRSQKTQKQEKLNELLQIVKMSTDQQILFWQQRTEKLLNSPESFRYEYWCDGQWNLK